MQSSHHIIIIIIIIIIIVGIGKVIRKEERGWGLFFDPSWMMMMMMIASTFRVFWHSLPTAAPQLLTVACQHHPIPTSHPTLIPSSIRFSSHHHPILLHLVLIPPSSHSRWLSVSVSGSLLSLPVSCLVSESLSSVFVCVSLCLCPWSSFLLASVSYVGSFAFAVAPFVFLCNKIHALRFLLLLLLPAFIFYLNNISLVGVAAVSSSPSLGRTSSIIT